MSNRLRAGPFSKRKALDKSEALAHRKTGATFAASALLSAAAVCGFGLIGGAVHAESLADAISLAYQTNPTLQAQRATQRALDENVVQARAAFRPTISLNADATDTNVPGTISDRNTSSGSVALSQPIYTGGRASSQLSATPADVLTGQQNLRRVESRC